MITVTDRSHRLWQLDARDLSVLRRWQLDDSAVGSHGIRPADQVALVSGRAEVTILDHAGDRLWSLKHPPWEGDFEGGAAWFDAEGRPFAVVPSPSSSCEIVHLDVRTGKPLHLAAVSMAPAGVHALHHANGWVGLTVGEGQDGAYTWWVRLTGEGIELIRAPWDDEVLFDVDATGNRILTTPHDDGPIRIRSFPQLTMLRELLPPAGYAWDYYACLIGEVVVARAHEKDGDDGILVAVDDEGTLTTLAQTHDSIHPGPDGSWFASTDEGIERWCLSEAGATVAGGVEPHVHPGS